MNTNNLGKVLKERRKEKKLKLKQLAAESGVSTAHLYRIEKGLRKPSGRVLSKVAKPLGFTEVELFKLAGLLPPDESDGTIEKLKKEFKREIGRIFLAQVLALIELYKKIDSL